MPPALCCVTPNLDNREENFTEGKVRKKIFEINMKIHLQSIDVICTNDYPLKITSDGHF